MGYANCGTDSQGRAIGYAIPATCDHPGCNKKIDRGLDYVCGRMHGEDEYSCEKYFCHEHKANHLQDLLGDIQTVCDGCQTELLESGEWVDDDGLLVYMSQATSVEEE
ncbi:hypothetical protein LJ739_06955 [Aestuariibacter halophilus]|uniref:Uncharacterized protein n=1 Tax=Fluctibacter halophilus TaxID=226011 RepID=A0ABS8G9T1_9ALTE|nr:hypothetical protein [Aestuariibacter halophilus]MCC2615976.1 hypothetical protein [Aestuariibacter halophilus]